MLAHTKGKLMNSLRETLMDYDRDSMMGGVLKHLRGIQMEYKRVLIMDDLWENERDLMTDALWGYLTDYMMELRRGSLLGY